MRAQKTGQSNQRNQRGEVRPPCPPNYRVIVLVLGSRSACSFLATASA